MSPLKKMSFLSFQDLYINDICILHTFGMKGAFTKIEKVNRKVK